jgi:hypothetical protein
MEEIIEILSLCDCHHSTSGGNVIKWAFTMRTGSMSTSSSCQVRVPELHANRLDITGRLIVEALCHSTSTVHLISAPGVSPCIVHGNSAALAGALTFDTKDSVKTRA